MENAALAKILNFFELLSNARASQIQLFLQLCFLTFKTKKNQLQEQLQFFKNELKFSHFYRPIWVRGGLGWGVVL